MKKALYAVILLSISSIVSAETEYYVDENGNWQERWVDNSNSSYNDDGNNGWNNADEDGATGILKKAYDSIMDNSGGAYDNDGNFDGYYSNQ